MKRIISAVLVTALAAAVCVAAAGCGKKAASASPSSSTTVSGQTTTAPTVRATQPTTRSLNSGTSVPTTSPTDSTLTTDATGTSQPGNISTIEGTALEYYGLTTDAGAAAVISSTQNAPDGTPYALVYIMYNDNIYSLFVATDGSVAYEPEAYFEVYGMSAQDFTQSVTNPDENGDVYDYDEYNYVEPYDYYPDDYYYYYGYGYGPDGAQPY